MCRTAPSIRSARRSPHGAGHSASRSPCTARPAQRRRRGRSPTVARRRDSRRPRRSCGACLRRRRRRRRRRAARRCQRADFVNCVGAARAESRIVAIVRRAAGDACVLSHSRRRSIELISASASGQSAGDRARDQRDGRDPLAEHVPAGRRIRPAERPAHHRESIEPQSVGERCDVGRPVPQRASLVSFGGPDPRPVRRDDADPELARRVVEPRDVEPAAQPAVTVDDRRAGRIAVLRVAELPSVADDQVTMNLVVLGLTALSRFVLPSVSVNVLVGIPPNIVESPTSSGRLLLKTTCHSRSPSPTFSM